MRRVARIAIGHPRLVLVVWLALLIVAFQFGGRARENLHETDLQIPGTPGERAAKLTDKDFGGSISMAILIKGPRGRLELEGPRLVRRLQRIEGVQVLSPWDVSGDRTLREPSGQALLTLQVGKPFEQISDETTPTVMRELDRSIKPPLKAELTGLAPLMQALNESSLDSLDRGERIALPILFILLLLVFRSPVAALIPAVCGFIAVRVGIAVMGGVNEVVDLDALALNMVTMIGLALGVDYSLLIVSRFREELSSGLTVAEAVEEAIARAGRTVLFAGTALSVGMLGALLIAPGALLVSATLGVITATVLSVLVALTAMPAGLAILGSDVNRWQFGGPGGRNPWVRLSLRALRRPGVAAFFTILPLVVLSAPAVALNTGPPNVKNLPPDDGSRRGFESFERDRGSGWAAPFEITVKTKGPITSASRLKQLDRFQLRLARDGGVEAVLGPAALQRRSRVLSELASQLDTSDEQLAALQRGLRSAVKGTGTLREGIEAAASGAGVLEGGLSTTAAGTGNLSQSVSAAAPETRALAQGIEKTGKGAKDTADATGDAAKATAGLEEAIKEIDNTLSDQSGSADKNLTDPLDRAQTAVQAALRALGDASPSVAADPNVQKAKQEVQNAAAELTPLKTNLTNLTSDLDTSSTASAEVVDGVKQLSNGLDELATGTEDLDSGISNTSTGADQLAAGVGVMAAGTSDLNVGVLQLLGGTTGSGGAKALAAGLRDAVGGADRIGRGLARMLDGVVEVRNSSGKQTAEVRRSGTDINQAASSGFFVLAGIEGSRPQTQTNLAFAINTGTGGDTARLMVIPKTGPFDEATPELRGMLERQTERLAKKMRARAFVGGPAVVLDDFDRATSARFPYLVLMLVLVTFLVLLVVFRSPVLALCAVLLNLVTVGAAVGVMIVVFQGESPLLGGPGYLDAIALSGIFAVIFGLSIDYEVFLISRLLEGRAITGTTEGAIQYSLEKTATIITGAAAIMAGVFIAFALSPVANTRQFGVGLTVAVILDATVVRLILLPALIKLFGERTWAVPGWLDRILPRFSAH